ncbi:MAG: hypothetical protein Q7J31_17295 [Syntrophales bacterium]|nr:hypothetical protein [Syntrophales bacterium]
MKKLLFTLFLLFIFLGKAFAFDDINFSTGMTQNLFKEFSEQLGVALSYKPVSPAEPYGVTGFDIGVEVSAVKVDDKYWKFAIKSQDVPGYVLIPKLHVIKGLPFGIDVGAVFSQVPDTNIKYFGGEVKYALMKGSAVTPAVAVRGTYTQLSGVDQLDFKTYGAEATISKGVGFGVKLTPYAGLGVNWFQSTPSGFASAPILSGGLGLSEDNSTHLKAYAGARFTILLIAVTGEVELNDVTPVYSLKAGLAF